MFLEYRCATCNKEESLKRTKLGIPLILKICTSHMMEWNIGVKERRGKSFLCVEQTKNFVKENMHKFLIDDSFRPFEEHLQTLTMLEIDGEQYFPLSANFDLEIWSDEEVKVHEESTLQTEESDSKIDTEKNEMKCDEHVQGASEMNDEVFLVTFEGYLVKEEKETEDLPEKKPRRAFTAAMEQYEKFQKDSIKRMAEYEKKKVYLNTDCNYFLILVDRPNLTGSVRLNPQYSAPDMKYDKSFLTVSNDPLQGYEMTKCSHGVSTGKWYFEATISLEQPRSNVRMGWAQFLADPEAPVGFDEFGYGYISRCGRKVHSSRPKKYGDSYQDGDTIGFLIDLPEFDKSIDTSNLLRETEAKFPPRKFTKNYKVRQQILPNSRIEFFKNGASMKSAFENIYRGKYHPAISVYHGAKVKVEFGPHFKFKLPEGARPMCEASQIVENYLLIDHAQASFTVRKVGSDKQDKQTATTVNEAPLKENEVIESNN